MTFTRIVRTGHSGTVQIDIACSQAVKAAGNSRVEAFSAVEACEDADRIGRLARGGPGDLELLADLEFLAAVGRGDVDEDYVRDVVRKVYGALADAACSVLDIGVSVDTPARSPAVLYDPRALAAALSVIPADDEHRVVRLSGGIIAVASVTVVVEVALDGEG